MSFFVWVAFAVVLLAVYALNALHVAMLRRSGRYPERGKATMADVERLLRTGSKGLAVRCYREIHACSLREASAAVRALSSQR